MSHSKRNTSLAFFTNYERDQLKERWGSQKARLTRESFLPLGACHLCLQSAREPVACRDGGHIFCRECAVTNLLTQKKEIKRLEIEDERQRDEEEQNKRERANEVQEEAVRAFEKTMAGTEAEINPNPNKRKHADSSSNNTYDERATARRKLDTEKQSKSSQPFWMPTSLEVTEATVIASPRKSHPTCPSASSKNEHPLSLKLLISVNFNIPTSKNGKSEATQNVTNGKDAAIAATCPSCKKALSSSSKAILTVPCGHVICKVCVDQFMKPKPLSSVGKHGISIEEKQPLVCYVCQTNLTDEERHKKESKKSKEKGRLKPGLVELYNEGTGFAGGGKAVVDKGGIAFQC